MVAVVAVVLDHLIGWPSGGFVGVDVFFVISGFLITGLLIREHERTGTISFWGFYKRRIKRIIPVALIVVAFTVTLAFLVFNQARSWSTFWDGFFATIFAANWHLAAVGTDYFQAGAAVSPLQHYWSLSVEEQFYFVWPWLMLVIFLMTGRLTKWSRRTAWMIAGIVMLAITAASFAWSFHETLTSPTWAYFSTLSRTWELGVGALLAVFGAGFARIPDSTRPAIAWIGIAGIVSSVFLITSESAFPAPWAALPVLSTALVIIAGTGGQQRLIWPLTNPLSRYIGDISYSMYVWHWPIIVFGFAMAGDSIVTVLALAGLILLVSVSSYHLLEDPIRKSSWLEPKAPRRRRRHGLPRTLSVLQKSLIASLAGVTAVGLAGAAIASAGPASEHVAYAPPIAAESQSPAPGAPSNTPELDTLQAELANAVAARTWPTLNPTMDEAMQARQAPDDVMRCGFAIHDESQCTFGDSLAQHTAVIVGNSISMTFVRPLTLALEGSGWNLVSYGMFGCPFADYDLINAPEGVDGCAQRPNAAVDAINRIEPELVFVSGARPTEAAIAQLRKITADSRIVYLPPPPVGGNVSECFNPLSAPNDCLTTADDRWDINEKQMAQQVSGVILMTDSWFCVNGACPSFSGTIPVRQDTAHMTAQYGERIAPVIRETLVREGLISE